MYKRQAHSYTGEESAELHCHGSPIVLNEVLRSAFAAGARQAKPCLLYTSLLQDFRNLTMSTAEAFRGKRGRDINELKGAIRSAVSNYLFKACLLYTSRCV